ncbi:MAG: type II toxin-antitoxin system Phd/YefM family antitoxin [Candidatus Sericytochromatia bacterium]
MGAPIGLGQLRSGPRGYLDRVAAGETLEVVRRRKVVARIVPAFAAVPESLDDRDGWRKAPGWGADAQIEIAEVRRNAAPYFDRVAAGECIGISHRGVLVARIIPATPTI